MLRHGPASQVSVQAKLDSVNLLMGNMTSVHLTVTQPKGVKGDFPLLRQIRDNGVIPVCGDSVELRAPSRVDTVESGNTLTITYDVPVQAFDSAITVCRNSLSLPDMTRFVPKVSV